MVISRCRWRHTLRKWVGSIWTTDNFAPKLGIWIKYTLDSKLSKKFSIFFRPILRFLDWCFLHILTDISINTYMVEITYRRHGFVIKPQRYYLKFMIKGCIYVNLRYISVPRNMKYTYTSNQNIIFFHML